MADKDSVAETGDMHGEAVFELSTRNEGLSIGIFSLAWLHWVGTKADVEITGVWVLAQYTILTGMLELGIVVTWVSKSAGVDISVGEAVVRTKSSGSWKIN